MHSLSFVRSAIIGLFLSAGASVVYLSASLFFTQYEAIKLTTAAVTLAYLLCLLWHAEASFGKITCVLCYLIINALCVYVWPNSFEFALLNVGIIWLVRSIYFHSNFLVALGDGVFSLLSFTAAIAATMQSDSVFLSFWSFFLTQAMILPVLTTLLDLVRNKSIPDSTSLYRNDSHQQFQQSYRDAENALRKIANQS